MSQQGNIFLPPSIEQRIQALGETENVSIIVISLIKRKTFVIILNISVKWRHSTCSNSRY
jgi:hypothetical protein